MRPLIGAVVGVFLGVIARSASAQNAPAPAATRSADTVLVLLPTIAPDGVALGPFARTLELYSKDYHPVLQRAPLAGTPPEIRAQAIEWGRARGAHWVLYATWGTGKAGEKILSLWAIDAARPDRADEVSTLPVPENLDAAFYREIGLKVRTLLRTAAVAAEERTDAPAPSGSLPRNEVSIRNEPVASSPRFALELSTSAETATDFGGVTPGVGLSVRFSPAPPPSDVMSPWSFGVSASYGFPRGERTPLAEGDLSSQRLALSGRRRIVSLGGPFEFLGAIEAGAMRASMRATLRSSGETRDSVAFVPFGTVSLMMGLRPSPRWVVLLGPDATFFTRKIQGFARSSEVLSMDYVMLAGVLRLQAAL